MNETRTAVSTFGTLAGIEHGKDEVLQGNRTSERVVILSWPGPEAFRILVGASDDDCSQPCRNAPLELSSLSCTGDLGQFGSAASGLTSDPSRSVGGAADPALR
jgi:hypothetical protein